MSAWRVPTGPTNTGGSLLAASLCATVMKSLWLSRPTKRVVGLGMADLRDKVFAAPQRAALAPTGLTRETTGGQPLPQHEVMMSRRQEGIR